MPRVTDNGNVYREGARMRAVAALAFFQAAIAKIRSRGGVMEIHEDIEAIANYATPQYYVASDWHGSIGTAAENVPGGMTDWRARVVLIAGPLVMPPGHAWRGRGGVPINDQAPGGSELWADSGYTGTGTRLVSMGAASYASGNLTPNSTRIERMTINGRSVAGITGVWSNSIQETCGIFDASVISCHHGIVLEAHASYAPANFTIERNSIVLNTANAGNGIAIYGTNYLLLKNTVTNTHATTSADVGITLRGSNARAINSHIEGCEIAVDIGGPDTGVGSDVGYWDKNISVAGLTCKGYTGQTSMLSAVRIRNDSTYVFNINVTDVEITSYNAAMTTAESGSNIAIKLIDDQVNGIVIPADNDPANTNLSLAHYRFGGSLLNGDAGNSVKRPVFTSYYDALCPGGAVMAAAVAGTVADLSCNFAAGADADVLQITATATPILQGLAGGRLGRVVYGHNLTGSTLVLDHNNGGTAANRFHCSTGADINIAVGSEFRAVYGDIRGVASWSSATAADRWYVESV